MIYSTYLSATDIDKKLKESIMSSLALVAEKKYEGKYVAFASFTDKRVVASGKDPVRVLNFAEKKGITEPVIVFIPRSNISHIY